MDKTGPVNLNQAGRGLEDQVDQPADGQIFFHQARKITKRHPRNEFHQLEEMAFSGKKTRIESRNEMRVAEMKTGSQAFFENLAVMLRKLFSNLEEFHHKASLVIIVPSEIDCSSCSSVEERFELNTLAEDRLKQAADFWRDRLSRHFIKR